MSPFDSGMDIVKYGADSLVTYMLEPAFFGNARGPAVKNLSFGLYATDISLYPDMKY